MITDELSYILWIKKSDSENLIDLRANRLLFNEYKLIKTTNIYNFSQ